MVAFLATFVALSILFSPVLFSSMHSALALPIAAGTGNRQSSGTGISRVATHQFTEGPSRPRAPHAGSPAASEPAPVGLVDYGTTDLGGSSYYLSNSFRGDIEIGSLTTYNAALGADATSMTFQLNVVLGFQDSGNWYAYWIQNVAWIDTATNAMSVENNIWNFSASSSTMSNSAVQGNGTVYPAGYYATGLGVSNGLLYPIAISLVVNTSVDGQGQPVVTFMYDLGGGYVTYDAVHFIFVHSLDYSDGFVVDGQTSAPNGLYYDAELVLCGPGGGSTTQVQAGTSIDLSLLYWNGNNYQSTQDAENYGMDTAESVSNAISAGYYYTSSGQLFAQVSAGSGTLGWLWSAENVGTAVLYGPSGYSGTIMDGSYFVAYGPSPATLLLYTGRYNFSVDAAGTSEFCGALSIPGAGSGSLRCPPYYVATFGESGLPGGQLWAVSLNGEIGSSRTPIVQFYVPNGTYVYSIFGVPGYKLTSYAGYVAVSGSQSVIALVWTLFTFPVVFAESGLPGGTTWSVMVGSNETSSSSAQIEVSAPNGTVVYTLAAIAGYRADRYSGVVSVSGSPVTVDIAWHPFTYPVYFNESGLPNSTSWAVQVGGLNESSAGSSIMWLEPNGSFAYRIHGVGGYFLTDYSGSVEVVGGPSGVSVAWKPTVFTVTFSETGLPSGAEWTVVLANESRTSSSPTIQFLRPNGTFDFSVHPAPGFEVNISSGTVHVGGVAVDEAIGARLVPSPTPTLWFGYSGGVPWAIIAVLAAIVVSCGVILGLRTKRKRSLNPPRERS